LVTKSPRGGRAVKYGKYDGHHIQKLLNVTEMGFALFKPKNIRRKAKAALRRISNE
jgi:hypothetical protein